MLATDAWGQGYATEALQAMVDLARSLGLPTLGAFCHPDHMPSIRVLEKCGFKPDSVTHTVAEFPNLTPGVKVDVVRYELKTLMRPSAPRAFRTPADFRAWLERHHATEAELMLRLYKVHAASKGITYLQALDEALCYGWIDGVRRSLDADSFTQRFTPRKATSYLEPREHRQGRRRSSRPAVWRSRASSGIAKRDIRSGPGLYSFERSRMQFSPALERQLQGRTAAWTFFQAQPPGYRGCSPSS